MEKDEKKKKSVIPRLLPFLLVAAIAVTMFGLDYFGYVDIENMFGPPLEWTMHIFKGSPYEIDYGTDLIPMLNSDWKEGMIRNGYTFYLESGKGFPPMGMILGPDGILRGTPTATGKNTFVVCVKDVGGNSKCVTAILIVEDQGDSYVLPNNECPATSHETATPCGTNQTGGSGVSGVYVPLRCQCPSDTYDYNSNFVSNGVEYRTCVCLK